MRGEERLGEKRLGSMQRVGWGHQGKAHHCPRKRDDSQHCEFSLAGVTDPGGGLGGWEEEKGTTKGIAGGHEDWTGRGVSALSGPGVLGVLIPDC